MPVRIQPLVTGEIYHVFNRGLDHRETFTDKREYKRALNSLEYYQFEKPPVRFSLYSKINHSDRVKILNSLKSSGRRLTEVLMFTLMPNHFHLLLKQLIDKGISKFMANFQNSYTRYFNTRHERTGNLFNTQFKSVRVTTEEQLMHVFRYIVLNPYSSAVVRSPDDLLEYPWTALSEYLAGYAGGICNTGIVNSLFSSKAQLKDFIYDRADYQRHLGSIKHLLPEV